MKTNVVSIMVVW